MVKSRAVGRGQDMESAVTSPALPPDKAVLEKSIAIKRVHSTGRGDLGLPDTLVGRFDTSVLCGSVLWKLLNSPRVKTDTVTLLLPVCHIRAEE